MENVEEEFGAQAEDGDGLEAEEGRKEQLHLDACMPICLSMCPSR